MPRLRRTTKTPRGTKKASRARLILIVPCFNEADRMSDDAFIWFRNRSDISLLFVDDGSTDATPDKLRKVISKVPSSHALFLPVNGGKGEAVRQGFLKALERNPEFVGFLDADLAVLPEYVQELMTASTERNLDVAMGSRVQLLGRNIERNDFRHFFGRIFATAANWVLQIPVYDTQCGLKLFRNTPGLQEAIEMPFLSRWAFDVELLGRLLTGSEKTEPVPLSRLREFPLEQWQEVPGSRVKPWDLPIALWQLWHIKRRIAARHERARYREAAPAKTAPVTTTREKKRMAG